MSTTLVATRGSDREAARFDLLHPPRLSPNQVRVLNLLHERVAGLWEMSLAAATHTEVTVTSQPAQESDGALLTAQSLVAVSFNASPHSFRGALCFELPLAFALVQHALGSQLTDTPERPLTELETAVLRRVCERLVGDYARTWRRLGELELRTGDVRAGAAVGQLAGSAGVCLGGLQVTVGESSGIAYCCLPMPEASPLLSLLSIQAWVSGSPSGTQAEMMELLKESAISVRAVLGTVQTTLGEICQLGVGDLLLLPGCDQHSVTLEISAQPKFRGKLHEHHGSLVVQLTTAFASEEVPFP